MRDGDFFIVLKKAVPAYVILQLSPARGAESEHRDDLLNGTRIRRLLARHDGRLLPPPEFAAQDNTSTFVTIAVPDMARADKLAAALRGIDGIETAFAKPAEELP